MFEKANGLARRVERVGGLPQQSWEAISLLRYNVAAASDGIKAKRGSYHLRSKSMFRGIVRLFGFASRGPVMSSIASAQNLAERNGLVLGRG